jgi:hypothetical protein
MGEREVMNEETGERVNGWIAMVKEERRSQTVIR